MDKISYYIYIIIFTYISNVVTMALILNTYIKYNNLEGGYTLTILLGLSLLHIIINIAILIHYYYNGGFSDISISAMFLYTLALVIVGAKSYSLIVSHNTDDEVDLSFRNEMKVFIILYSICLLLLTVPMISFIPNDFPDITWNNLNTRRNIYVV